MDGTHTHRGGPCPWSNETSATGISPRRGPRPASSAGFIGLVAASAAVAALVVAAATPAIAMVGLAASGTIGMFDNLPGYLEIDELSEKSNIYAVGKDKKPVLLASFYDQNRVEVGWSADRPGREGRDDRE